MEIISQLVVITTFILVFYFILFIFRYFSIIKISDKRDVKIPRFKVIIPAFNEEEIIKKCIEGLLLNKEYLNEIIIVVNNSADKTIKICKSLSKESPMIKIINFNGKNFSKVKAISKALSTVNDEFLVLLDADTVLVKDAIKNVYLHTDFKKYILGTGIIDPLPYSGFLYNIFIWDRIFRQRFLQKVKFSYGMSNFPGCFGIVKTKEYKKIITNELLEDYDLTLKTIYNNKKISFLDSIVGREFEKRNLRSLFFQRVRWTTGNLLLIPKFFKTFKKISLQKKMILLSYPLFWYFLYYYLSLLIIGSLFYNTKFLIINYMIIAVLFFLICTFVKLKYQDYKLSDILTLIIFIMIFPLIIFAVLFYTLPQNISSYFNHENLFKEKYFRR